MSPDLSARARRILYAVITEFIASGEAVGSRTLEKKYGLSLSAASIRNVLADLEEAGYLLQRHTSAGRVPTDKAFRFFVDALMELRPLAEGEQSEIAQRFDALGTGDEFLRGSGRILSELTGTAAVVVSTRPETRTLRQLHFIPTRPGELLAVLVMNDGTVENRFLSLPEPMSDGELSRIHNLLADVVEGRTLGEVRELCERRLADERTNAIAMRRRGFELGRLATAQIGRAEVRIEGQAKLFDHPELDVDRLKQLAVALSDQERLLELLENAQTTERAQVLLGNQAGVLGESGMSLVAAPYTDHGRVAGAIGVVGLVRMDYPTVVPVVAEAARAMSATIDRKTDEKPGKGGA